MPGSRLHLIVFNWPISKRASKIGDVMEMDWEVGSGAIGFVAGFGVWVAELGGLDVGGLVVGVSPGVPVLVEVALRFDWSVGALGDEEATTMINMTTTRPMRP